MIRSRHIRARTLISAALASSLVFVMAAHATEMPTGGPPAQYIDYLNMKPMRSAAGIFRFSDRLALDPDGTRCDRVALGRRAKPGSHR